MLTENTSKRIHPDILKGLIPIDEAITRIDELCPPDNRPLIIQDMLADVVELTAHILDEAS